MPKKRNLGDTRPDWKYQQDNMTEYPKELEIATQILEDKKDGWYYAGAKNSVYNIFQKIAPNPKDFIFLDRKGGKVFVRYVGKQ